MDRFVDHYYRARSTGLTVGEGEGIMLGVDGRKDKNGESRCVLVYSEWFCV